MPSPGSRLGSLPLVLLLALFSQPEPVQAGTLPSRWGHSLALVPSPEYALVIASGKLDTSGQTYTSASTTASSVVVPLGAAFSLADVDTLAYDVAAGPPYAWGSVEALGDSTGRLLTFGGDGSPVTALQTGTDSAWLYSTEDGWAQQDSDWAGEPMRREGAASCTLGQTSYFTAGSRADGSVTALLTTYAYDASNGFVEHPSTLPSGLLQPSLHCLSNGTLLLLGGYDTASATVPSLSTAYTLDTTISDGAWRTVSLGGAAAPAGRRAALAVTFGSGSGLFVAGGGTGQNGLEQVLDDAFVLDFATGEWSEVAPTGTGPGARLGARGVAVGNSQVLFFGGYTTNSAADGALYLYDLSTNAYLDTFTPPSTWSSATSDSSSTAESAEASSTAEIVQALLSNAVASHTTTLAYTYMTTAQTVVPAVLTDAAGSLTTSFVTSDVGTSAITVSSLATVYEVTLSSGATSTVYPAALASVAAAAAGGRTAAEGTWDPATYTGIIPGYATLTTSGAGGSSATGGPSSEGSSDGDDDGSATPGTSAMSSKEKTAIGVGTTLGFLALAAVGVLFVVRKRRRAGSAGGDDEDEKAGLAGGRSREWSEQSGGTWSNAFGGAAAAATWNDFTGRERKRVRLYGKLSEKLAELGVGAGAPSAAAGLAFADPTAAGAGAGRRWGMLDDEDTRRYETYPPPLSRRTSHAGSHREEDEDDEAAFAEARADDGNSFRDVPSAAGNRAGMGIYAQSPSFAPVHGASEPEAPDGGDIGYGRLHDEDEDDLSNPFEDGAVAGLVSGGGLKRSTATDNFYPNAHPSTEGHSSTPESSNLSYSSHYSADDPYSRSTASGQPTFPPSSSFASIFYPQAPPPSRANSNSGWRKVLGLNLRAKSPPPASSSNLTNLPPSLLVMGSRMRDLRDPATPPVLGFDEDLEKGEWAGRKKKSFGQLGRGREASSSSLTSARTATSDQFERFNHLDIIQRNRTTSGSTATPEASPELESSPSAPAFQFPPRTEALRNPFEDDPPAAADLIALSPASVGDAGAFARPWARPTGARPSSSSGRSAFSHSTSPSLSAPSSAAMTATASASSSSSAYSAAQTPGSLSPFSIDSLSPNPAFPSPTTPPLAPPAAIRRSVRDTVAAFEQQHSTTEPLHITKKARTKKPSTSYSTVARPTLMLANPDSTPREPSD